MDERSARIEARLEVPMLVAAAMVVPLLLIEHGAVGDTWRGVAVGLNWAIWLAFLAESIVMLSVVPDRCEWLRRHPLEVVIVLGTSPLLPASMQAVRAIRLLRVLRLLLLARRARFLLTPAGLSYAAIVSVLAILGGGASLRIVEPSLGLTLEEATWWAMTTATTVGYGDIVPATSVGRVIAGLVMLNGIGFVALLTAAIARMFIEPEAEVLAEGEQDILQELRMIRRQLATIEARLSDAEPDASSKPVEAS